MGELKIEKGVPIPSTKNVRGQGLPFDSLEVGDSFFCPAEDTQLRYHLAQQLCQAASKRAKRNGMKYTTRQVDGGVRVWRLE